MKTRQKQEQGADMADEEERSIEQLNDEADIAADYLEGLLDIVDYEGDIELAVRNGRPTVEIVADDDRDIKNLIGRHGEVVNALQQLARLAVQQKTGERSRLILDVDGYLSRRRKHLEDVALDAVDEVRESGEPVSLRYMNSFERKIVHDVVREEGLKSRSHGVEPKRYVTIYMKAQNDGDLADEADEVNDLDAIDEVGVVDESNDVNDEEMNFSEIATDQVDDIDEINEAAESDNSDESDDFDEDDVDSSDDDHADAVFDQEAPLDDGSEEAAKEQEAGE
ncbi:R3H domain protein [Parascardovia denticolens DSM 10105 = JCM 12538]|uniref:R3H domain protein n=1 Tax=Parascardovia denticolens DSM 10105 = JCM 12538 TaxID=864564 RepID=E6JYG2_PARDN|nr:R3H domain protein [Parascardovia denticolens DSM 10105 = JCM 12538]